MKMLSVPTGLPLVADPRTSQTPKTQNIQVLSQAGTPSNQDFNPESPGMGLVKTLSLGKQQLRVFSLETEQSLTQFVSMATDSKSTCLLPYLVFDQPL